MEEVTPADIGFCKDGDEIQITATLSSVSHKMTRDGAKMAIARIKVAGGPVDVIIFPDAYKDAQSFIMQGTPVTIQGRIDDSRPENTLKLLVNTISVDRNNTCLIRS